MEPTESARKVLQLVRRGSPMEFPQESMRHLDRKILVNRLNYVNFQDGTLLVNFRHANYAQVITLEARPLPCQDDWLDCSWVEQGEVLQKIGSAVFEDIFVVDGHRVVVVAPAVTGITENGISFRLPEKCREMSYRKMKRHLSQGVRAQLVQNSAIFHGTLLDFNAVSFHLEVEAVPPQTFQWIDPEQPVSVSFSRGGETHFSGTCRILKHSFGARTATFVVEPTERHRPRFRAKTFRSTRQSMAPSPTALFRHPFTGKTAHLKVHDISGIGFAAEEDACNSLLPPGLIIPDLELGFANTFSTMCKAQVVYRDLLPEEGVVRCGLTILDMEVSDHVNLLSLLYQDGDKNAYLCHRVNMEKLWQFFFETGYIAPHKYLTLRGQKEKVRALYEKLYNESPRLARHFIYEEKGAIVAHMALIRCYENSWLLEHQGARHAEPSVLLQALNRLARFANDSHRLFSMHMNYLFSYCRPGEEGAGALFEGVALEVGDRKGCSVDTVACLPFSKAGFGGTPPHFADNWHLASTTAEDLQELAAFYEDRSGGLLLEGLELLPDGGDGGEVASEYQALHFTRERRLFSLRSKGTLTAVFALLISDLGLGLVECTNCVHLFVLSPGELTKGTVELTLSILLAKFRQEEMPVFIYPHTFAEENGLSEQKSSVWVLSMQHTDHCLGYLERQLKNAT